MPVKPKPHEWDELKDSVEAEVIDDASEIAQSLFPGGVVPGMAKLSESEYLGFVRAHWPDQQFRLDLLGKVGPRHFIDIACRAWGVSKQEYEAAVRAPVSGLPMPVGPEG